MGKMNVAYMRVSTEAQTKKYGLDVQRDKIQDLADKNNAKIERWYVDGGYSGSNIDRPEMQRLLDDARDGKISSVYVYKLDRMSRDAIDTLTLLYRTLPKYGVKIESVTEELRFETPMDKVMVGVNAIMGQYEREVIYMRTRAGMVERVKKGLWMGGGNQPYGYYYDRNDGILHPKEDEAENVRRMFEMYNSGMSCRSISEILGIKCEKVVRDVLRRKSNIGYIEYNGVLYKGLHEPIVDEDVFWNTQELIERRSNNYYLANKHILSGLCFCGKCGAKMRYKMWGSYFILECYSREGTKKNMVKSSHCDNKRNKASYIEKEVTDCFKKFIINVEPNSDRSENKELVKNEIKKSNEKLKRLYLLYSDSGNDVLFGVIKDEEKRLNSLKVKLEDEIRRENSNKESKIKRIRKMSDIWDELDTQEKNKILKECIEKIIITDDDIEIRFNIE